MCCSEKLEIELCFSSIITVVTERLEEKMDRHTRECRQQRQEDKKPNCLATVAANVWRKKRLRGRIASSPRS